ncbi:hypothetical protein QE152_g36643 [Popillia japonica]|uniref:Uncharacterized protein n=1 Tax=Popillia japonica TaxID=7064 RepID=A0AAW1ICP0_POPJA
MGDYYRERHEMKKEETEDRMKKGAMEGSYSAEVVKEISKSQGENEEITENRQSRQAEDIKKERNVSKQERGNYTLNITSRPMRCIKSPILYSIIRRSDSNTAPKRGSHSFK